MSNVNNNMRAPMMRLDTSRADRYLYPDAPKLSFMQKFGRTVGKIFSFAAPVAGAALSFIPGVGLPLAAGCFGLGKLSGDMVRGSYAKEQNKIAQQQAEMAQVTPHTPGLFDQGDAGQAATDFIVPPTLQGPTMDTVIIRDGMRGSALENF